MLHLGDITKINGAQAPVVDCVIGGSPCQDLSVAGKRAGLAGERSGLFMEQIRIIKEMREADVLRGRTDDNVRPRYMVWENVPGAFSSNGGKDFAAVLEETVRIIEPEAPPVPVPEKGWPTAGCLMGEKWSVAWRVLDAQFWGVPQRRRRIALVADFGGLSAPEILFVRKGLSGNSEQSEPKRKEAAGGTRTGADSTVATNVIPIHDQATRFSGKHGDKADGKGNGLGIGNPGDPMNTLTCGDRHAVSYNILLDDQGGQQISVRTDGKSPTLRAEMHGNIPCVMEPQVYESHPMDSRVKECGDTAPTVTTKYAKGGVDTPLVCYSIENHPADSRVDIDESGKVQTTLTSRMGTGGGNVPMVMEPVVFDGANVTSPINASNPQPCDPCHTLSTDSRNILVEPIYCLQGNGIDRADTAGCNGAGWREGQSDTLNIIDRPAVAYCTDVGFFGSHEEVAPTLLARGYKDPHLVSYPQDIQYIVRRLTPLECERLQGFPDGWTDIGDWVDSKGKKHKAADSPRFKALGNSIAIPPWRWILKRLCACYERDATMASLFDGIGGFPYIWEQLNGKGSCLWASEIDEFPMAVTKVRFGE